MKTIAIDIGGTFIKWALIENGEILEKGKEATEAFISKGKGVVKKIAVICEELNNKNYKEILGVGISMPGVIDSKRKRTLVPLNHIPEFENINIEDEFHKYCELPIAIINDANASALGEYYYGSLKGSDNSMLITLGTGIGAGIIINGKLYLGHNYSAGEVGQHKTGTAKWESVASTRWLVIISNFIKGETILNGEEIIKLSKEDPELRDEYENWIGNIAVGLSNLIQILSPEKISIGGGISENKLFDIEPLIEKVEKEAPLKFGNPTKIVKAELGNSAALLGASKFLEEELKK